MDLTFGFFPTLTCLKVLLEEEDEEEDDRSTPDFLCFIEVNFVLLASTLFLAAGKIGNVSEKFAL